MVRDFSFLFEEEVSEIMRIVSEIFLATSNEAKRLSVIELICLIGEK
jgi:hypothetical protein